MIHVADISHPDFENQINEVTKTLNEIGAGDKPMIIVFNKIDAYTYIKKEEDDLTPVEKYNFTLEDWKRTYLNNEKCEVVFISAREKQNIEELKQVLYNRTKTIHAKIYPYNNFLW